MEYVHTAFFVTIDCPAGRLDNLSVPPTLKLGKLRATQRMLGKLADVFHNPLDQLPRSRGVIQSDVVSNRFKVAYSGLCPDYFSHRVSRCFA